MRLPMPSTTAAASTDADGNLRDWWTPEDARRFKARSQVLVEQFNEYTVLDSLHVNGELTLGENIADLGGVLLAFDAFHLHQQEKGAQESLQGYTPDQRFFMAFASLWRNKYRPETIRQRLVVDPHSPSQHRANGPLSNCGHFFEAFNIPDGAAMRRPDSILVDIW